MVSGGFDPIHVGHVRMINEASRYGNLVVVLNSDEWLLRKKGYVFMPWDERAEIIRSMRCVTTVVSVDDRDGTVCDAIKKIKPYFFANGGDRKTDNTPEKEICKLMDVRMLWNVGGGKVQSSSDLVKKTTNNTEVQDG